MANATNIVLPDALATPVNHTFALIQANGIETAWEDRAAGIPIGFNRLRTVFKAPSPKGKVGDRSYQVQLQIALPTMETLGNSSTGLTPAPTVAHTARALVTFELPERSSLQNRKDLLKYLSGALANAQIISMIETLDRPV